MRDLVRGLWAMMRRQPARGVVASVVLHLAAVALVLMASGLPSTRFAVKRGEPLFVELPEVREPAPQGNPAAKTVGAPARPAAPAPKSSPAPKPAPAPPPVVRPAPERTVEPPPPPRVATQPTPPEPQPAVAPPPAVEPPPPLPQVAEAPPAPSPPPPAPPAQAAPATPTPEPTPAAPAPEAAPRVALAPTPAPVPEAPPVDIRSALGRGSGAGGAKGGGRGGIDGEPIPLDSADIKYSDYLERLRRRIKSNWGFPCIKNAGTRECEYKTASLVVEFGILKDGRLQFVEVVQSSGFPIYDDYAVNAIKLGSPFPAVPTEMIVAMKRGSTGVSIMARFNYVVDTSLTNLLR